MNEEPMTTEEPRTVLYGGSLPGRSTAKWLAIKEYCYTHPGKTGVFMTPAGSFYVTYYPAQRDLVVAPEDSGLCCMADHANAVPPWTCSCPCHTRKDVSHDPE